MRGCHGGISCWALWEKNFPQKAALDESTNPHYLPAMCHWEQVLQQGLHDPYQSALEKVQRCIPQRPRARTGKHRVLPGVSSILSALKSLGAVLSSRLPFQNRCDQTGAIIYKVNASYARDANTD